MNSLVYQVAFRIMARWLTPKRMRKPKMLAFLNGLAHPFIQTHQDFLRYAGSKRYHLKITSQVCYLQQLLNSRYDRTLRRIYIDDLQDKPPVFIYKRAEDKPQYLFKRIEGRPKFMYTRMEGDLTRDFFVVYVPISLIFNMEEMASLIRVYKLAGTKFKIQSY